MTTTGSFQRLPRARLSQRASEEIKRAIADGRYPPGSRLPSEGQLARELGVTRLTLREALNQLEALGLTVTKHGSGTYVADLGVAATFRTFGDLIAAGRELTPSEALGMMEFREIVIAGFAELLLKNARSQHVKELRRILAEERKVLGQPQVLAVLDYEFNEALSLASGNFFYTMLIRSLREIHLHLGTVIFGEHGDDGAIVGTQSAIVDALEARRAQKLHKVLDTYLAGGTAIVRRWAARTARCVK